MRDSESARIVRSPDPIEQPVLRLALVTLGDPHRQTGGHRYHRTMARAAPGYGAEIRFCSIPDRSWPLAMATAARAFRAASERCGVGHGWIRSLLQGALDRLTYRHGSGFIAAGQSLVDTLRGLGVPDNRIRLVPPGCDVPVDGPPRLDLRQGRDVAVLCVANWTPNKGIVELVSAFASLPESAATLWLVGATDVDRAYAERVRRRISAPNLSDRVVVRGALPFDEVARMYRSADVFALCSSVDAYGTAWAEAISAGLPVIGWRTANLPHLAEHGREALMPEPGDLRGLASALHAISSDAGLRERLSAGAKRRAGTLPAWRDSEEAFFGAVREFIEAAGRRRRPSIYRSS